MTDSIYLIQILKDYLHGLSTVLPDSLNLGDVINCANKQNVEGILYAQTKIPELQKYYAATIYSYLNRAKIFSLIENELRQEGIEFFTVKGFEIAKFYPQPQLRTMGDTDIVVHPQDKEKVHQIMIGLGAKCFGRSLREWHYQLNGFEFEIHDHLLYKDSRNSKEAIEFFDKAWEHIECGSLDWNFHFIFLLYHLRKHILGAGAGLRQFIDLAVVIRKSNLDWDLISNDISYLHMNEFFNRVLNLIHSWFDIEVPKYSGFTDKEFEDKVTEDILNGGVFGFYNSGNEGNIAMRQVGKNGKHYLFINILQKIFVPYKQIAFLPEYHFLEGRPYLLPAAWIYRLFLKWKNRHYLVKKYIVNDEQVNARTEYLKEWGLWE